MNKELVVKKLFAFVMSFVMLFTSIPLNFIVAAEPQADVNLTINADKTEVNAGDVVTVSIDINENTKIIDAQFSLKYDSSKVTPVLNERNSVDVTSPVLTEGNYNWVRTSAISKDKTAINCAWTSSMGGSEALIESGTFMQVKFTVNEGAKGKINFDLSIVKFEKADEKDDSITYELSTAYKDNTNVYVPIPLEGIKLDKDTLTLNVNQKSDALKVTKIPEDAMVDEGEVVTWDTSKPDVATIENGVVTAKSVGVSVITARYAGKSAICTVTVNAPLESISLSQTELSLEKGGQAKLDLILNPTYANNLPKFVWSSEDGGVANVDQTGLVTATGRGTTNIKVKSEDGRFEATCKVGVTVPIDSITLNVENITLRRGVEGREETTLIATINPDDATIDADVAWISNNDRVVKVEKINATQAKITAVGNGDAKIVASLGSKSAECNVKVETALKSITFGKTTDNTIYVGQTDILNVQYLPEDTTDLKEVEWTTSSQTTATVENGTVIALAPGEVTITATSKADPTISTSCTYNIQPILATGVQLNYNKLTLKKNETFELIATVLPENTTDSKDVKWTTSDEDVVSVVDGKITAVSAGENVKIRATSVANEELFAECTVNVIVPLEGIEINEENVTLKRGVEGESEYTLTAKLLPEDTTDKLEITWISSNENIVTVNNGKITAVSGGTAQITAVAGEFTSKPCNVKVEVPLTGISIKEQDMELLLRQILKLTLECNPEDTTDESKVEWSSSNDDMATVDENGVVTAKAEGEVIITAKKSGFEATTTITIKRMALNSIAIKNKITEMLKGQTELLEVIFEPENTTDSKDITWSSSDEEVATVDENGNLVALKAGEVTITATSAIEGVEPVSITFTVKEISISSVTINKEDVNEDDFTVGKSFELKYDLNPANATDGYTVKWLSSDENIATVDENGVVTAKAEGNVKITLCIVNEFGDEFVDTYEIYIKPEVVENVTSPGTGDINITLVLSVMILCAVTMIVILNKKRALTK